MKRWRENDIKRENNTNINTFYIPCNRNNIGCIGKGVLDMTCKYFNQTLSPYSKGKLPQCLNPNATNFFQYISEEDCEGCRWREEE